MEPDESWAYRARADDPLVQVVIERIGTKRPARVFVRFVDDAMERREGWIPPARLKVRWQNVEDFRASEARWQRVYDEGPDRDDPRERAADIVFDEMIDDAVAELGYSDQGAVRIRDMPKLSELTSLTVDQLSDHPACFTEREDLIVPWPTSQLIVRSAVAANPEPILQFLRKRDREAQREAIYGRYWTLGRGREEHYTEPEICKEIDDEHMRPYRDVLRSWCPASAIERFDELQELRIEIRRVGEIAEAAIKALDTAGERHQAAALRRSLGSPVEMLRPEVAEGDRL